MVYYLTPNEWRLLNRRYLVWARRDPPSDEWRGWNWDRPPLEPPYDVVLSLHEIASQHCPTGRDLYLRRVEGLRPKPSERMLRGRVLHSVVEEVIVEAKRSLYSGKVGNGKELYAHLMETKPVTIERIRNSLHDVSEEMREQLVKKSSTLWDFESLQLSSNLDRVLSERPSTGIDALVNTAIPFVVERVIDGSFLGLSESIRVDALAQTMVVLDLKTGKRREFQHLYTVGYALALEAELEGPVDVGVVVYLDMDRDFPLVWRELHVMDESLRREFIEERNRKMKIVQDEEDPGLADKCPIDCPFYTHCRGSKWEGS